MLLIPRNVQQAICKAYICDKKIGEKSSFSESCSRIAFLASYIAYIHQQSLGLYLFKNAFMMGLFFVYYWRKLLLEEFCLLEMFGFCLEGMSHLNNFSQTHEYHVVKLLRQNNMDHKTSFINSLYM